MKLNTFIPQRIVEIKSLVTETENAVLTSSIDRSIKVWNLDYIFEKEHHIDKHELTIDSLSISTSAQLAVAVTRSCIGCCKNTFPPGCCLRTAPLRYLGFYDWEAEVQAGQLSSWSNNNTRSG